MSWCADLEFWVSAENLKRKGADTIRCVASVHVRERDITFPCASAAILPKIDILPLVVVLQVLMQLAINAPTYFYVHVGDFLVRGDSTHPATRLHCRVAIDPADCAPAPPQGKRQAAEANKGIPEAGSSAGSIRQFHNVLRPAEILPTPSAADCGVAASFRR